MSLNNMTDNDRQCATYICERNTMLGRSPKSDEFVQARMSAVKLTRVALLKYALNKENTSIWGKMYITLDNHLQYKGLVCFNVNNNEPICICLWLIDK